MSSNERPKIKEGKESKEGGKYLGKYKWTLNI